jgi:hypothetical protein
MKILALAGACGGVHHAALLRAAARLAPPGCRITLLSLGTLPLFNPDLEAPPRRRCWRCGARSTSATL